VFLDNRPRALDGSDLPSSLRATLDRAIARAASRAHPDRRTAV
jgi:hypothetical protein